MGERQRSAKTETCGTYPGARVERGPHWRFQEQDGGAGCQGTVREVVDSPDGATRRSVVSVEWGGGQDNLYSRGHRGAVHVQAATVARGPRVYAAHLPLLGKAPAPKAPAAVEAAGQRFQLGQQVMVASLCHWCVMGVSWVCHGCVM